MSGEAAIFSLRNNISRATGGAKSRKVGIGDQGQLPYERTRGTGHPHRQQGFLGHLASRQVSQEGLRHLQQGAYGAKKQVMLLRIKGQ